MPLTALQIIEARSPLLEGAARLPDLIALAREQLSPAVYGASYELAVALQTLHYMALQERGGAPGPVTSEAEGSLSRSYGWSGVYGNLASTSYGLELMQLAKRNVMSIRNRRM